MAEFLPLCDVLFNVISLAGYFCDVVFDVVMGYALLERGYKRTFAAAMSIVVTSLLITQVVSLRWHLQAGGGGGGGRWARLPLVLHVLQLGVLWRYARLFVPVDLRRVKHQVRDLCMLRLVHAFCEAAPMLLLQLHVLLAEQPQHLLDITVTTHEPQANKAFEELNVISASLSLFSVCWALASFSKNVRLQNVHRLVLTWLGVIFQFLWRLGTISARICALTVYALVYEYWVFLVIGLHWVSMFLWLISPKNVFHGERISRPRKAYLSALIAFVYVFAYVNLQELNHRQKMITFYCVMAIENGLLVAAWAWSGRGGRGMAPVFMAAAFIAGLVFMLLYYRYFHVRRLGYMLRENHQGTNSTNASSQTNNGKQLGPEHAAIPGVFNCRFTNPVGSSAANGRKKKKPTSFVPPPAPASAPAPAAFWRRPLPAHNHHGGSSENEGSSVGSRVNIQQKLQEKKQKQLAELRVIEEEIKQGKLAKTTAVAAEEIYSSLQRQPIPRAKTHAEPPRWSAETHPYQNYPMLPHIYPTYTEIKQFDFQTANGNVPSTSEELNDPKVRRQNRLYEQNERSLYENPATLHYVSRMPLKTGYIASGETRGCETGYTANGETRSCETGTPQNMNAARTYAADERPTLLDKPRLLSSIYEDRQPPEYAAYCDNSGAGYGARSRTPELLLAPRYLPPGPRPPCCHWGAVCHTGRKKEGGSSGEESGPAGDTPRPPSDIESQISLPRSYTLPREFRYWRRRPRLRDALVPSNNSSDGDVDSADSEQGSQCSATSQVQSPAHTEGRTPYPHRHDADGVYGCPDRRRPRHGFRKQIVKPETKL